MHNQIQTIKESILNLKKKGNKPLAVYITNFAVNDERFLFNGIKESISHYIAFTEVLDKEILSELISTLKNIEENITTIIFDAHITQTLISFEELKKNFNRAKCFIYSEQKSWSDSTTAFVHKILCSKSIHKILVLGESVLATRVRADLADLACSVESSIKTGSKYDLIIGCNIKAESLSKEQLSSLNYPIIYLDAGIGNFSEDFIKSALNSGSTILRIDHRASLSSSLISILETDDLFENVMGAFNYEAVRVVAGGIMGNKGDVVVDNAIKPKVIIGIANGAGKIVYPPYQEEDTKRIDLIRKLIRHNHE